MARQQGPLAPLPNGTGWGGGEPLVLDVRQCSVGARLWERGGAEREAGVRHGRWEPGMAPAAARRLPDAEDIRRPPMLKDYSLRGSEDGGIRDSRDSRALSRGGVSRRSGAALGTGMSNRLSMQVVSPTRHQLRQWKAMAGEGVYILKVVSIVASYRECTRDTGNVLGH
jgi:hypothetical protein